MNGQARFYQHRLAQQKGQNKQSQCLDNPQNDQIIGEHIPCFGERIRCSGRGVGLDVVVVAAAARHRARHVDLPPRNCAGGTWRRSSAFPETRSGKYMRRTLRAVLLDEPLGDLSTLRNPDVIDEIREKVDEWRSFGRLSEARRIVQTYRYLRVENHEIAPGRRIAVVGGGVEGLSLACRELYPGQQDSIDLFSPRNQREPLTALLDRLRSLYAVDLMCDPDVQPFYERLGMRRATGMMVRHYDRQAGETTDRRAHGH